MLKTEIDVRVDSEAATNLARGVDLGCVPFGLVLQVDLISGEGGLSLREGDLRLCPPRKLRLATSKE